MADFIDRGKLLEYIDDNFYPTTVSCYMTAAEARAARKRHNMFIDAIKNANTVDAVPVRRGRWIDMGDATVVCSECNNQIIGELGYDFCPNCGAKMDGGEKDD